MRNIKASIAGSLLVVSAGVIFSVNASILWPWIPLSMVASVLFMTIINQGENKILSLTFIVSLSAFYRAYILHFPSGLIGFDPLSYAIDIQRIIQSGSIDPLSGFYGSAPAYHLIGATTGIVTGVSTTIAMLSFPLLIGATVPILGYLFGRRLSLTNTDNTAILAAGIAAITSTTVSLSYQPIAQTISLVPILLCIFYLDRYTSLPRMVTVLIAIFSIVAMLTHKLALVLIVIVTVGTFIISKIPAGKPFFGENKATKISVTLVLLPLLLLAIQWTYQTNFIVSVIFKGIEASSTVNPALSNPEPLDSASFARIGLGSQIFRNLHGLVLLPIAGIGWVAIARNQRYRRENIGTLVSTAILVILIFVAVLEPDAGGPRRFLLNLEPILSALVASLLVYLFDRSTLLRVAKVLLIALVVFTQVFSGGTAVPDFPNDSTHYLHEGEAAGKNIAQFSERDIGATTFFAGHETKAEINQGERKLSNSYTGIDYFLVNNSQDPPELITWRPDVRVHRTSFGKVILEWDIENYLVRCYHKIHSTGPANTYSRATTSCP